MRRRLVLAACGLLIAAAAGVTVWRIPDAARDAQGNVDGVADLGRLDRVLSAGREFDLETDVYVDAARLIPSDATYFVATGTKGLNFSGYQGSVQQVLFEAPVFARYFLAPRRQTIDPKQAGWIFSYGGDLGSLGLAYRRVIVIKPGWEVAEVAR
jgi:hypothetical protein